MKFIKFLGLFALIFSSRVYGQVSVYAKVDHLVPDGIDTQGGISLTVSGSTAPYTYTWNPGAINTKDINNINGGQYTVNVRSASSQTYTNRYSLGYKVDWTNLYKCYFRNDSLVSTANNYCRAVSKNTLPANTDGWFEYIISEMPIKFALLGLVDSISPNVSNFNDIDFGFRFHSSFQTVHYFESGTSTTLYSTPKIGDVFRVERIGNTINYRVNGTVVRTITNASIGGRTYKLKASLTNEARVLNLGCSFLLAGNITFPNYINVNPYIKHASNSTSNDGQIILTPEISGTYNYTWYPSSSNTNSATTLSFGNHSVDIVDSENYLSKKYYNIGYKVNWTNLSGCYFRNDSLVSSINTSSAVSKNTLLPNTDGWVEFVLDDLPFKFGYMGFTDSISPDPANINDIDFGLRFHESQRYIYYWENGGNTTMELSPKIGDVYRIERIGNTINYKLNGIVLRTITQAGLSSKTLKLKANLYSGFKLVNLGCSFNQNGNGYFANYINAYPLVRHATNIGTNDASITSINQPSGSYTYTWQPSGSNTNPAIGLDAGIHRFNIEDSDNNISSEWFNVGYKVNWTNMNQCTFRNDSLVSTTGLYYQYCKAVSKNTLPANTDGWFEFALNALPTKLGYIGFLDSININAGSHSDIDYGIYLYSDGGRIGWYENGSYYWLTQTSSIGDIIRIERVGNTINYKINGIVKRTVTSTAIGQKNFKLKAALTDGIRIINLGCSFINGSNTVFPGYVEVRPKIVRSSGVGINDGKIEISKDFFGLKDYVWEPTASNTATLSNLVNGSYSVTVSDSSNNTSKYSYDIGYKTKWKNFSNCFFRNDTLKGTGANGIWGYACTKNVLASNEDGWFEYVITKLNGGSSAQFIGFVDTTANNPSINTDIQYGFYYYAANKTLNFFESSQSAGNVLIRTPTVGDVVRIERIGNTINYKVNGIIVRTITNTNIGAKVFKLKMRLYMTDYYTHVGASFPSCPYTVNAGSTQTITCSNPSVTLTSTTTVPSPSYTWSAGGTSPNSFTTAVSSPGIYTLTVSNSSGCMAASTVAVVGSTVAPSIAIESTSSTPTLGLNAYWPFNGNADDVSGNANNGTITDATLTNDRFGNPNKAYYFNGTTSRIDVPNSSTVDMPNGQDYSISFWMKAKPGNVDATPIAKNQYGAWSGYMFFANSTNGGYCNTPDHGSFYVAAGGGGDVCSNNAIYNDTTNWYFITGQYQASTNQAFMYVNSVLQSDVGSASGATSNTKQLSFGAYNDAAGFGYFKGALDDIRFYNRLLTQSEINSLYNETKTTASNVVIDTTIVLQASPNISGMTYTWSPGGSSSNSYSTSISSPGVYSLSVTNPTTGCVSSATVLVVTKLSATATVTDYENDTVKGHVTLNITGGVPPYNIAWNGLKYPLPAAAYKLLKDSISGIVIDSVKFVNYIDSIRQITVYNDLLPSTNYAVIYDQSNDSIILSVSVSNKINNWAAKVGAVTTSNPINKLSVGNVNYFYGSGVDIVQSGTFALGNSYAVLPNTIDLNKVNEISFIVPNNMDVAYVGLVDQNSPLSGTYYDLNQKTMFKFNGNGSFDVVFNSQSIYNGSFGAGDYFSIKANNTTGKIGYYKNEALLIEADISGLNMGGTLLLSKVVLGNANASVAGLKIKLPYVIGPIQILPFNKCFLYSILYSANASANPNPVCAGSNVTLLGSLTESSFFSSPQTVSLPSNSYSWLPGNLVGAGPLTAVVQSSQIYTLSVSYVGCVFKKTIAVNTYNLNANAGADVFVTSGTNVTLGVAPLSATGGSGNYSYVWTPAGTYVPNAVAPTPVITSNSSITYTLTVTDNVTGCISIDDKLVYLINEPYYFVLKKKMDAGYYNSYNNKIYFKFEEEYYDGTNTLMYSIVDDKNLIMALPSLNPGEMIGDNQYSLILSNIPSLIPGNFYRLSITNKKNEVFYARFKY